MKNGENKKISQIANRKSVIEAVSTRKEKRKKIENPWIGHPKKGNLGRLGHRARIRVANGIAKKKKK